MRADTRIYGFKAGLKWYPENLVLPSMPIEGGNIHYVDGDVSVGGGGQSWEDAFKTVAAAVAASSAGDVIYVAAKTMTATSSDPVSYTENLDITVPQLSIIGVSRGLTQGGLPQLKVGATTTSPIINIAAPGVLIANLGINGISATGGGICIDDDGGTTSAVIGTSILGCHIKNCVGTTATNALTGGGIYWTANGGGWQARIAGNTFYKNVGDIILKGTSVSVPQDVIIEGNTFQGIASAVDVHIIFGGSGMLGFTINNNTFADVLPALGSATTARYVSLVGTGIFSNNSFAGSYTTTGFGAAKVAAVIPTTVGIVHNYSDAGLIVREA